MLWRCTGDYRRIHLCDVELLTETRFWMTRRPLKPCLRAILKSECSLAAPIGVVKQAYLVLPVGCFPPTEQKEARRRLAGGLFQIELAGKLLLNLR